MTTGEIKKIPFSFHDGNYKYSSTNTKVLEFTDRGEMKALKSGNTTIVLTHTGANNKKEKKKYKVKVHDKVKKLKWKKKTDRINIGEKYTYSISYKAASKKNIEFKWSSSNPKVAEVDQEGNVKAVSAGITKIKCKMVGDKKTSLSTKLQVVSVPVSMINVKQNQFVMKLNTYYYINQMITVSPDNATNKMLNISSQDESVIKVEYGLLHAVGTGNTIVTIEATDGSGCKQVIDVTVDDWIGREDTHFIAHRGLSAEAPENTVKAFELAGEKGFYAVETDVWLSKDGQFVISHDGDLKRMCGVDKNIGDLTYSELKAISIKSGCNYDKYKNDSKATTIPTLKEYLMICQKYNMIPMIEVKFTEGNALLNQDNALYRLYEEVTSIMGSDKVYVISFHQSIIKDMNEIRKIKRGDNIKLCLLAGECNDIKAIGMYQYCLDNNIGFSIMETSSEELIKKMLADGAEVGLWTVDVPDNAKKYIGWGVKFIVTDKVLWKE